MKTKLLTLGLFLSVAFLSLEAQIVIGTLGKPESAAILDLKTETVAPNSVNDISNVTTYAGGLNLPRVYLVNKKTLEPFISTTDTEWLNDASSKIKTKHAGLIVYNIYQTPSTVTNPDLTFRQGTYIWNGSEWQNLGERQNFFPMPATNLPMPAVTKDSDPDLTFDLYQVYSDNYTNPSKSISSNSNITEAYFKEQLHPRHHLDYVVTHYDADVLIINSIDADGVMHYRVKDMDVKATSFLNIYFSVKDF